MGKIGQRIVLSVSERDTLSRFVATGEHPAKIVRRAQIILALDSSKGKTPMKHDKIVEAFGISRSGVAKIKCEYSERGIEGFLERKKRERPPVPAKVDGEYEAHLIALSCSDPPEGYSQWSLRLLADRTVELGLIDSVSHMTVGRVLKKTNSSLT
jgi:transposase